MVHTQKRKAVSVRATRRTAEVGHPKPEQAEVVDAAAPTLAARAIGRRKEAVARVQLHIGEQGLFTVNDRPIDVFFASPSLRQYARAPLTVVGKGDAFGVRARVRGGGVAGQAAALRLGIARALVQLDSAVRPLLRASGMLTRDPRVKERKKFGLKKARRAPQWSKR